MDAPASHRSHWEHSQLIVDADAFYGRLLEEIARAGATVDFEYYLFSDDVLGQRFVAALSAAAQRGVRVRVLMDGVGSSANCAELSRQLHAGGVAVKIFRPLPWLTEAYRWSRHRGARLRKFINFVRNINRRDHCKLCVIDQKRAWLGSFNISAKHLSIAAGGRGWRDYGVELAGAHIAALSKGFERLWSVQPPRFHRGFIARYLSNRSARARALKNRFVARQVAGAASRVWLVSAYFVPTASLRRALLRACRAGKDVRLLLPEASDVAAFPGVSSHYYRELLRVGARIFLYQSGNLHAKALLVDDIAIVGSSNWNYRSALHDLELDAILRGPGTVEALAAVILQDCSRSRELQAQQAPLPGLASWFWYLLRYWM